MDIFHDDTEYNATHIHMFQRVVDMFEHRPDFQRIVRLGLLAEMNYADGLDAASEDDYDLDDWVHSRNNSRGYPRHSDRSSDRESSGKHTRSSTPGYQFPLRYYSAAGDLPGAPFVKDQPKESNTERRARVLQEEKKSKGKAEKKRLKKQKQKARKEKEKLEKEKHNPVKNEEEKTQDDTEESETVDDSNSSAKVLASAKDTDSGSSEDEFSDEGGSDSKNDSGDSEELDMTSTFVSKAALIARRKLEQKPKTEKKEKKKTPVKNPKSTPDKPNEDPVLVFENKDAAAPSSRTLEDNVKISTDLANVGNKFASAGDFNRAVKYFTDAIKYNPTEYKLFGNRSFCFEKMQEYTKALTDAELSLGMCPGWAKGLFRKGRALAGLKRYEEAAKAFRDVLKLDSSCAEAAQELMRVQLTQLMEYGFTRQQSSNALIIHGTVPKALEVLSKLNQQPEAIKNGTPLLPQVANVSGVSPVLSASANTAAPQSHDAPRTRTTEELKNKPLDPVQNMPNGKSQPKPIPYQASRPQKELFPIWVGNLVYPVTETVITNLFKKVGVVYSVKVLTAKRCAFVNYTKQEDCDEAIRRFHGSELNGMKIAVRYPDRIPHGMGFSKSALKADDLQDENVGHNNYGDGRSAFGSGRPVRPHRQVPNHGGNHKE